MGTNINLVLTLITENGVDVFCTYLPIHPPITYLHINYLPTYIPTHLPRCITYLPTHPLTHLYGCTTYLPTHTPTYIHVLPTYIPTHLPTYILPTYPLACLFTHPPNYLLQPTYLHTL